MLRINMDLVDIKEFLNKVIELIANFCRIVKNYAGKNKEISFILLAIIIFILYCLGSFPSQFSHLEIQTFKPSEYLDNDEQVRDLRNMRPSVFENQDISVCSDIEVTKRNILYCVNDDRKIVSLDVAEKNTQVLYEIQEGDTYGLKLSKNEKLLYFVNSALGLCEFNIKKRKVRILIDNYLGEFLISLKGVEINPSNPNIIYFTQSSKVIPLQYFSIDFWFGNAFGRVFEFNKKSLKLSLIAEGLYTPSGIAFQKYNGYDTLIIAETNRYRLARIYLNGYMQGVKQTALEHMEILPDYIKTGEKKGEILVGSIGFKSPFSQFKESTDWVRKMLAHIPPALFYSAIHQEQFGGLILQLAQNNRQNTIVTKCFWNSYPNYILSSTLQLKNGNLFVSSSFNHGVLVIDYARVKLKKKWEINEYKHNKKSIWVFKFGDRWGKRR